MAFLPTLSLSVNLALFTALAVVVWFTGTRLSDLADRH
jgi:hypothetical protein